MIRTGRDLFQPKLGLTIPLAGFHLIFFFLFQADPQRTYGLFAFQPAMVLAQPWILLTYQFLHADPMGLFFGTLVFYILGMALEAEWGTAEYAVFWLVATLGGSLAAWILGVTLLSGWVVIDVSMLLTYAYLYPEATFFIWMVVPVKVKWLAYLTTAGVVFWFVGTLFSRGIGAALTGVLGATAGFLFFWIRHHGRFRARKAARGAVQVVKSAGALRQDMGLERRNRALFPKVEALRAAAQAGTLAHEEQAFASELASLVVPGVKVCKPVDFKGDKDGICVKCEGFAECSLRYVAGQPEEIVVRSRE